MTIGEAVRQRIIQLCQERDISINKLSSISGVTQSTVNNIVSGRNNSATVSTVKKLCDGLGITIEEFFHSVIYVIHIVYINLKYCKTASKFIETKHYL